MPHYIALMAGAREVAGQVEEASALLDEALQIVERTGERWFAAELNRHKGELLLRQGHAEAAEELYRKALSIAEEQGAKLWELRAAASLARLRRDQGRPAEARDLLGPIYDWFTEGFDTPDLKEAKALLDELAVSRQLPLIYCIAGEFPRKAWQIAIASSGSAVARMRVHICGSTGLFDRLLPSPMNDCWECNRRLLISAHGLRGSRIVNSLYSPTLLSTAMLPPCCCVTMS